MKKYIFISLLQLFCIRGFSGSVDTLRFNPIESVSAEIVLIKQQLSSQKDSMNVFRVDWDAEKEVYSRLEQQCDSLQSEVMSLKRHFERQQTQLSSLTSDMVIANQNVSALSDSLSTNIINNRLEIQTHTDSLNKVISQRSQWGLGSFVVLAVILIILAFVLGKLIAKRGNEVATLSAKADRLNEEIVNRLSSEITEIQTISKQIGSIPNTSGDIEQKLISTLADRITFMEMTLYKMDSSVRGHKQLSKSIKQMKDNLLANGYELVDMLGKDYHDGMKVTANFVEDENLPEGKQIITGIIKPQINYQGKMIQSAQITVSQNL